MLMFSHGVSSGWLRETKVSGAEQQPGALAGGDPGVGKEDIGARPAPPNVSLPAGDLIPCRERGEVFNVCREIKRKFPSRLIMLSSTEVVHRRFVARRQRRISDPGRIAASAAANRLRSLAPNGITFPSSRVALCAANFRR